MAGPSSRQLSMDSPSSNPSSPSLMRPPAAAQTGVLPNGTTASASSSAGDYLNPNAPMSTSPSPLRTTLPYSTQSPEDGARQSPTSLIGGGGGEGGAAKSEDGFRPQMVPAQSPNPYTMYTNGDGSSNNKDSGGMGTPGQSGGDGAGGAASTKFVHKLFRMVSDAEYQHLISWNASGTSVVVTNFDEFAKEVLGKHFKHSNFSSFIRQLNM